ncbi:MAG: 30S ribosomal protein S12 methylthiotransferase RimO [Deltaproteobacteria bacterium]|nr:MAG: 30S ribosomal protein S12 methylthiotransferase RimO [Deltaproteobacteria bacterium]
MISLGCPKNLVDSEVMLGTLSRERFEITTDPQEAGIIVVNTCGFIESAKEESIEAILEAARHKETGKAEYLVVAGCLVQRYAAELAREIPEVDLFIGTGAYHRIADLLAEREATCSSGARIVVGKPGGISTAMGPRLLATPPYTTYLKIAEGCSRRCSFCIIPRLRGGGRSRPIDALVAEARALAEAGCVEFNLVAQDLTAYGRDLGDGTTLARLLAELVKIPRIRWIRLLYAYPWGFDDELLSLLRNEEKLCKYIDLPLQHIDDEILAGMRRDVTRGEIEELLGRIRDAVPGIVLRTSFIVGFPGETEAHFEELLRFVERQRFDRVGVFTYSPEEGTPAWKLPGRVSERIKARRRKQLMAAQARISAEKNRALLGRVVPVLVEGFSEETDLLLAGRMATQAPEVDGSVYINDGFAQPGEIVPVRITDTHPYDLVGEVVLPAGEDEWQDARSA